MFLFAAFLSCCSRCQAGWVCECVCCSVQVGVSVRVCASVRSCVCLRGALFMLGGLLLSRVGVHPYECGATFLYIDNT